MAEFEQKISIIIPFFNREKFLSEAIESVIAQNHDNWEIRLINDGSSDKSKLIAENYAKKFPNKIFLHSHENEANRGASAARNLGIKFSSGDFITFLDSDDILLPNVLEKGISIFNQYPQAEVVCGTLEYYFSWSSENNQKEQDFTVNLGLPTEKIYDPPALLIHNLRSGGRKPGIGCVILKSTFTKNHTLFQDDFRYVGEDQIFWAKVSLFATVFITGKCFTKYRQHPDSSSSRILESGKSAAEWNKVLDWLDNYLDEKKIHDPDILNALKLCRKENNLKERFKFVLNFYRRLFPYHLRYRIRDFIVRWRSRHKNY